MKIKFNHYTLIILAIFVAGTFLRIYSLNTQILWVDEPIYIVGGIKLVGHDTSGYDPRQWNFEHPPLAKYLIGIPSLFSKQNYSSILSLTPNYYAGLGNPDVAGPMRNSLDLIRLSPAISGILLLAIIYLFTRDLYGKKEALAALLIATLSVNLLAFSRTAHLDMYMYFFSALTIYVFYKLLHTNKDGLPSPATSIRIKLNRRSFYCVLTGLFLGFSILTKTVQPLIMYPILIAIYLFNRKKTSMLELISIFIISLIVFASIADIGLYSKSLDYFSAGKGLINLNRFASASKFTLKTEPTIMLFFVFAILLYAFKGKRKKDELFVVLPFILIIGSFLVSSNPDFRYFVYTFPFIIIFSAKIFTSKKFLLCACPLILIMTYSVIVWFPDYTAYTNVIDGLTGRSYFWENVGFSGLTEASQYLEPKLTKDDVIFATNDAIRYSLSKNIIARESGTNTLYLVDGRIATLTPDICPTLDDLKKNNIKYAVIQNPKLLSDDYCSNIKDIYQKSTPTYTIFKYGEDIIKIYKL